LWRSDREIWGKCRESDVMVNRLCIQEMDYRQLFMCSGIIYFLKHYKHTARCVNTVQMSANCVRALPQNQQTQHACAPSWLQRCGGNICKSTRSLLPKYESTKLLQNIGKYLASNTVSCLRRL
jgi:hypothetical protein